jgi:hypothetical protein
MGVHLHRNKQLDFGLAKAMDPVWPTDLTSSRLRCLSNEADVRFSEIPRFLGCATCASGLPKGMPPLDHARFSS